MNENIIGNKSIESWIGNTESYQERIVAFPSNALAATLDKDNSVYKDGMPVPPLWHWLHFLPIYKLSDCGYDGHAALGCFLPPITLPRRMWAGGRLIFHAPILVGKTLRKVSTIKSVKTKSGRSGELVFVTVEHQIFDKNTLCVKEEHDIVYREKSNPDKPLPTPPLAPESSSFTRHIVPDPVLLFRFSALTFNGHRIHYDQPFCVGSEGYEGLVVHGPLLAILLLDLLQREKPQAIIRKFEFRAVSTIFDNEDFSLHGEPQADQKNFRLWVRRRDGALAMQAKATIA